MSAKRDEAAAELIDKIVDHAVAAGGAETTGGVPADCVVEFLRQYYRRARFDDLAGRSVVDLCGAALAHLRLAGTRTPGTPAVRIYNPDPDVDGWHSPHTVVDIVTDDMPFLIDSLTAEIDRHGVTIYLVVHPIMAVRRSADSALTAVAPPHVETVAPGTEAVMHLEIDRIGDAEHRERLRADLLRVLGDVRATVDDWQPMRELALQTADELDRAGRAADPGELAESADFMRWLTADHFTFIGARDYELVTVDGDRALRPVPEAGLGILRSHPAEYSTSFAKLPLDRRRLARTGGVVTLTKSQSRSTVHRATHFDFVGIKRFDSEGTVVGERRFLGLYTADARRMSPADIPLLRRKVQEVVKRAAFEPRSHDFKTLIEIINNYPRDELLQVSGIELYETAIGIMELQERPRVRLFARRDDFGRYVSCLVFVPRDRHTTAVRERITAILADAFGGLGTDFTVRLTESPLARLHVVVYTDPEAPLSYDPDELEARLAEAARSWTDDLAHAVLEAYGEEHGSRLLRRFATAYPAAYMEDYAATTGATDLAELDLLDPGGDLRMRLFVPERADAPMRFKLYRAGSAISVSDVLPVLENMGVRVVDERPYELGSTDGSRLWVYDFGLVYPGPGELHTGQVQQKFAEAFAAVWRGEAENDGFNRLVLMAEMSWREVSVLRAFAKYLRQVGTAFSLDYMIEAVTSNPTISRLLVELFASRLDPARYPGSAGRVDELSAEIEQGLDQVASLDEDRILRNFLHLTLAVLRTNYYQPDTDGSIKPYLSLKLDPTKVPDAPLPLPLFEIWVYSPRVEGVHLRGGRVARGGIRWSDRREDFRTEILGLMKAQMVKNAVIVPVGSKGGFVVKRPPDGGDRQALMAEVVSCYRSLIRGMLDLTDNLIDGSIVPPPNVVRHDDDDPYLVVAADKGTATFSDIANALSKDYQYWLGDAFASGGSDGYDHKEMGITARGAWESVKRHFRELGHDTQSEDFTVTGVGDMSGDVFGNGMLASRHIRLVAAFDHRHIFLDPDPDAATSYEERLRLARLPRSSWADYDTSLLSEGGGVFPRTAKSIPITPQLREALDIAGPGGGPAPAAMAPNELIRAILRAPVDLFWNGGIGTYVKAGTETNSEAGDRANDGVRVDGSALRCRVVGEGGNLGFTQRGRVEYALAGGKINTDAIDNSAGVDTSDHEVNIKILLDAVAREGGLAGEQRKELLEEMTDEVGALVLRDNYDQTRTISNACQQAREMLGVHRRYLTALERSGRLNRALEFLPDDDELTERGKAGTGLTRPEFSVLLAYSKMAFYDELLESDVPEDPYLSAELVRYFPRPLRDRFAEAMQRHPLRREIIATCVTNQLVNRAGTTFAFRMSESSGAPAADVARAWTATREMFDMPSLWSALEELDLVVPAEVQTAMFLEARKLHDRATRWLLRNRRPPIDIATTATHFAGGIATLAARLSELVPETDAETLRTSAAKLVSVGVPDAVAAWIASCEFLDAAPDIVEAAHDAGRSVEDVARVYFSLDERLQLDWLHDEVAALGREGRWQTLARAAMRDDLYAVHAGLTRDVLRVSDPATPPGPAVDHWTVVNQQAVRRVTALIDEIRATGSSDLATLSVALREVRSILTTSV